MLNKIAVERSKRLSYKTRTIMGDNNQGALMAEDLAGLKAEVNSMTAMVREMREQMQAVSQKLDKLAVLEERAATQKIDVERSFAMMRQLETRLQVIEVEIPLLKKGNAWIERGITVIVTAVLMAMIYTVMPHH